jgi:hypothetical protein
MSAVHIYNVYSAHILLSISSGYFSNTKYKINSEVLQLKQSLKHQHHEQLFTTLEETLINLDEDIYPTILTLLAINLTLPVSVASAERRFSSLKRLKTYLRNRMNQDGLIGLALLSIHRHKDVNIDDVINIFANRQDRKLEFLLKYENMVKYSFNLVHCVTKEVFCERIGF